LPLLNFWVYPFFGLGLPIHELAEVFLELLRLVHKAPFHNVLLQFVQPQVHLEKEGGLHAPLLHLFELVKTNNYSRSDGLSLSRRALVPIVLNGSKVIVFFAVGFEPNFLLENISPLHAGGGGVVQNVNQLQPVGLLDHLALSDRPIPLLPLSCIMDCSCYLRQRVLRIEEVFCFK